MEYVIVTSIVFFSGTENSENQVLGKPNTFSKYESRNVLLRNICGILLRERSPRPGSGAHDWISLVAKFEALVTERFAKLIHRALWQAAANDSDLSRTIDAGCNE